MTGALSFITPSACVPALAPDFLAGVSPSSHADKAPAAALKRVAPGAVAARDMSTTSSRSLTTQEKQVARTALQNARTLLDRTESALRENWNQRVPGSKLTNKQLFRQYFGDNTEALRAEVLARVQRVRDKVDVALGQDIGNTVVRATGQLSDYSAYVDRKSGQISLGDRFFSYRSASPLSPISQAGVFVHEFSHVVRYNGRHSIDEVPGIPQGDKRVYSEPVLKNLADSHPALAVANSNLLMWYVNRQK